MKLTLIRDHFSPVATTGRLFVDGRFECFTLEDCDRRLDEGGEKLYGQTAIPAGTFKIDITESPRFKRRLPILLDVPGFSGVRIHIGNYADDTEGCILVGLSRTGDFIGRSRLAFSRLFALLEAAIEGGDSITLEIVRG